MREREGKRQREGEREVRSVRERTRVIANEELQWPTTAAVWRPLRFSGTKKPAIVDGAKIVDDFYGTALNRRKRRIIIYQKL